MSTVACYVRAGEGAWGIWVAGVTASGERITPGNAGGWCTIGRLARLGATLN